MINTERLGKLMAEKGISQVEMSKEVGITQAMMSYIMHGFKVPSVPVLWRMAKTLDTSMEELCKMQ